MTSKRPPPAKGTASGSKAASDPFDTWIDRQMSSLFQVGEADKDITAFEKLLDQFERKPASVGESKIADKSKPKREG